MLADALKRLGLAERTGRGIDLMYQGMLRYGRPAPDYAHSDRTGVVVSFSSAPADLAFLGLVIHEENRAQSTLPVESLIALSLMREFRRVNVAEVASAIQRSQAAARSLLERLTEAGLVQAHGQGRGRTYTLGPAVYRTMGQDLSYVRQVGFGRIQQEQMVLNLANQMGEVSRKHVVELCHLSPDQASRLLRALVEKGILTRRGDRKSAVYASL